LRTFQDWIVKREIQTIPGVAKVISQGGHVRQYQIKVDPDMLQHYELSLEDVIDAARMNNLNLGAGIIERGSEELVVRTLGLIETTEDIERIVIRSDGGAPVLIRDVASVEFGNAFRRGVAILDGDREVVTGSVYKMYGANSFEVIGRLKERIAEVNETLPDGVRMVTFYDQSSLVKNSIGTVRNALIIGLILVVLVSFVFLGDLRNAIIVLGSLPFSTLFAFIAMERAGMPGDLISFGGIAIALGMIVDATIIMVEKIQASIDGRHADSTMVETVIAAAVEVGRPIFFATMIIIIVFLPIFTLGEVEGKMFRPLAFAVASTMIGALVYALVAAPVFYRVLHRKTGGAKQGRAVPGAIMDRYRSILLYFLRRRVVVISLLAVLVLAGSLVFFGLGREFVPTLQEGTVQVLAYMNPNISLEEIGDMTRRICSEMENIPEIETVVADIGYGEVGPHMHHTNYACITVNLRPKREWRTVRTQEELVSLIDGRLEDYPGVSVSFSQPIKHEVDGLVGGAGSAVVAKLFGYDMDVLIAKAAEIHAAMAEIDGVADLRTEQVDGQTQLQIDLSDEEISRHGLTDEAVERNVQSAVAGVEVGKVFEGDKVFGITARFARDYRRNISDIEGLLVRTPGGYNVPLRELASITTVTGLRQISREDTRRFISVQCNVRGRDVGSFVDDASRAVKEQVELPVGYRIEWGGQFELQQAADRRLSLIIPLTLFFVLLLLYGLFNSFKAVFLIMLNIPLAMVGGVFALALFRENVSIPS
ncbi:MAG TPA: efflux RND transporter permease subunit, partial [Candidatus Krumholzibacterium sp.]|nr:efflux RND transporter permease subunit [Candidatus Krumholzibacterium sp.]